MNKKTKLIGIFVAMILTFNLAAFTVSAADYYESASGNTGGVPIIAQTNVLYYKKPHVTFNIRIYVKKNVPFMLGIDTRYSIKMYDNIGRCVWSATNQGDRTYSIGSNVTKIVLKTNEQSWVTLYWQKR